MHPLSIFPRLLDFTLIAPTILRVVASLFVIYLGYKRYKKPYSWTSFIYVASGLLVFVALYTQITSLVAIIALKFDFYVDFWKNRKVTPINTEMYFLYTMAGIILLSLLVSGPGLFAFDLPL